MELLSFPRWCELVDGKYVDIDGAHGGQCWDGFADVSISVFGIPPINTWGGTWSGWAYAIWDQYHVNGAAKYWDRIGPGEPARAADIAIWTDRHWYYPASHIAPVIADAGADLLCMSQNSSPARPWQQGYHREATGPNIRQYLTKQGLAGYLRRKVTAPAAPAPVPTPKPKEWDEMASKAEIEEVVRRVAMDRNVLDAQALALLHRDCFLVDPTGKSFEVTGRTNLAKKINYMAHNDAQHLAAVVELQAQVQALAVGLGILLEAHAPDPEPAPDLAQSLPVLETVPALAEESGK